jgi:hypothetical protein
MAVEVVASDGGGTEHHAIKKSLGYKYGRGTSHCSSVMGSQTWRVYHKYVRSIQIYADRRHVAE